MALIDDVTGVCRRLAPLGWHPMMLKHGLDITAADLRAELTKELPQIDRTIPGFEDFAAEGRRGIEAGNPARSLLYHALASPNVVGLGDGTDALKGFPSLAELDLVENYVFGIKAPSLAELRARAQGALLAVVVFASEYRPAPETVQRKHADLCFSRTGVARVGTLAADYDPAGRGFQPFADDPHAIRVLPSRFSAYVAMQRKGDGPAYGPMQFELRKSQPERFQTGPDTDRLFWVPLHKLFSGSECLAGHDLRVTLQATHVNEKIRRIHVELARSGAQTWNEPDISAPPFSFTRGIATLSKDPSHGPGVVMPAVHPRVVEPASYQGKPLTFKVPQSQDSGLGPSLTIDSDGGFRHAPEYVHVRHSVAAGGAVSDLNDKPNVNQAVFAGGYNAQHYVDFTGDGWVRAVVPKLAVEMPRNIAAYSLVTAPDFYPNVDQRELFEWWVQRVPTAIRDSLWRAAPLTLSDERVALNISLGNGVFRPEDETGTTIVSLVQPRPPAQMPLGVKATRRHAHLPDAAAGIFAPGWDTSRDNTNGVAHLSAYGLGSPFPEDAKLCAALSTFWPAVAPDAGRSFSVTFPTVAPLTDEEIAVSGDLPWDGVRGPLNVGNTVEFASFNHVDYVQEALDNKFSLALTSQVDTLEYESRVLAMARTYMAAGISGGQRSGWAVASFRTVAAGDPELQNAQSESGPTLQGQIYRVVLAQKGAATPVPGNHRKVRVAVTKKIDVFVGSLPNVLVQVDGGGWQQHVTP